MAELSAEQLDHYDTHGWIAPIDVMTASEARSLANAFLDAEAAYPSELNAEHRNNAHLAFPFFNDVVTNARIVDAVEQLIGPDIALGSTVLFVKEPDSAGYVSWHQDSFYMGLEPANFVTAWLALTPSTIESGCVSVLPGTHHHLLAHNDTFGDDNIFCLLYTSPSPRDATLSRMPSSA